jgi:serine/threonine protein kinase/Tol biopolymer transport system component
MGLSAGARLGGYEIIDALGEGGMGEVYRARDTALHRDVAIKILPDTFAADADRVARFTREAQTLATLNHPHIAQIYGLEGQGGQVGTTGPRIPPFLVMELVDGEDLAQRIARGPIPLDEVGAIATEIAAGLEAAHDKGIIHRDLKPANIKLTPDGTVKILDFGLAKAGGVGGDDLANSPTFTVAATQMGTVLGTAAYMAPEQARGKAVDKRADIWAFGCVLFEMLTGRQAFAGETVTDILAAVVHTEPDWSALPAGTSPAMRRLLRQCLQKDPKGRLRDIGDATLVMADVDEAPAVAPVSRPRRRVRLAALCCIASAIAAAGATWLLSRPSSSPVIRTMLATSGPTALSVSASLRDLAITPDGTRIIYRGTNELLVRSLDAFEPARISGAGTAQGPFVSPDGQWVGFFDGFGLKKVSIGGGASVTIAPVDGAARGATWAGDTIVFATTAPTGLYRVAASGGEPVVLTTPDQARGEGDHLWPEFIDGRDAVLYTIVPLGGSTDSARIAVLDLRSGRSTVVVDGASHAQYVPTGHLVYAVAGTLRAATFDLDTLRVGTPTPVIDGVLTTPFAAANYTISRTGTLAYVPRGASEGQRSLVWIDRAGREERIAAPPRDYFYPRISPDGSRIALDVRAQGHTDIWIWHLTQQTLTRLTSDPATDIYPVWARDSQRVLFGSSRQGVTENLFWQAADGTGSAERLTHSSNQQAPFAVTADGRHVVARERAPQTRFDLILVRLQPPYETKPLIATPFNELNGEPSPDGRWLAYQSDASGQFEIYVQPLPDVDGGRWQVSTNGGRMPAWAPDGSELFYVSSEGAMMSVRVQPGPAWRARAPVQLFHRRGVFLSAFETSTRTFDVAPDGSRFLMITSGSGESRHVHVVQNWFEELMRVVPLR